MTPPDTNINKQAKRHWGPLTGITLALLVAAAAFLWWMSQAQEPTAQDTGAPTTVETDPSVNTPLAPPVGDPVEPEAVPPGEGNL